MSSRIALVVNALTGPELSGGRADANNVFAVLNDRELGACAPNGPAPLRDCDSRATFQTKLDDVLKNWRTEDQLILYFSGHGVVRRGVYSLVFGKAPDESFLPFDAIRADLDANGVRRAILILDACQSGAVLQRGAKPWPDGAPLKAELPAGVAVLASCRHSEHSWENDDGSGSVFTELLIEGIRSGLRGKATEDGKISTGDIINYVNDRLQHDDYRSYAQSAAYGINEAERPIWLALNRTTRTSLRRPFMVGEPPAHAVPRNGLIEHIQSRLLDSNGPRNIALVGHGGFGKTTLMRCLLHNHEVQANFSDGILRVTLGPDGESRLQSTIEDWIVELTGKPSGLQTLEVLRERFASLIAELRLLIVIDDAWSEESLTPFSHAGNRCKCIISTRIGSILPQGCEKVRVGSFEEAESIALLTDGLNTSIIEPDLYEALTALAQRMGHYPLMLGLANAWLCEDVNDFEIELADSLREATEEFDARGILAFDDQNDEDRGKAVGACLRASLQRLGPEEQERLRDLSVFEVGRKIAIPVVQMLWEKTGDMPARACLKLLKDLYRAGFIDDLDLRRRELELHSVIHQFLGHNTDRSSSLHSSLLDALEAIPQNEPASPYLQRHRVRHMILADRLNRLEVVLGNLDYAAARVFNWGVRELEDDLRRAAIALPRSAKIAELLRIVGQMAHVLTRAESPAEIVECLRMRVDAETWGPRSGSTLRPLGRALAWPSAYVRTLANGTEGWRSCTWSADGEWLACGGEWGLVEVWHASTRTLAKQWRGHNEVVHDCAFVGSRWLLTLGMHDGLRLWDRRDWSEVGHYKPKNGTYAVSCTAHPDGDSVAATFEGLDRAHLTVFSLPRFEARWSANGHADCTWSVDGDWLAATHQAGVSVYEGTTGEVRSTIALDNGDEAWGIEVCGESSLVIGTKRGFVERVQVKDPATRQGLCKTSGSCLRLNVHVENQTVAVADGQKAVNLLSLEGAPLPEIGQHRSEVMDCAFAPHGILATASQDGSVRLWNPNIDRERSYRELGAVEAAFSRDGSQLLISSRTGKLCVHDIANDVDVRSWQAHEAVFALGASPESNRLYTAGMDGRLCAWDVEAGTLASERKAHDKAKGIAVCGDDRIVTGGNDKCLRLWSSGRADAVTTVDLESSVNCIEADVSRSLVAVGCNNGSVILFAVEVHGLREVRRYRVDEYVLAAVFIDSNQLAITWGAGRISVVGPNDGELWDPDPSGHAGDAWGCAFDTRHQLLFTSSMDGFLSAWDLARRKRVHRILLDERLSMVRLDSDNAKLAVCGVNGTSLFAVAAQPPPND